MINKVIRIKNPELLTFLYPSFRTVEHISLATMNSNIIFIGKGVGKNTLQQFSKNFISLYGSPDLVLDTNRSLVEWAMNNGRRKLSKAALDTVDDLSDEEFLYYFKTYWFSNKWYGYVDDGELSTFTLFKSLTVSTQDSLSVLVKLFNSNIPLVVIESSLFSFLKKFFKKIMFLLNQKVILDF